MGFGGQPQGSVVSRGSAGKNSPPLRLTFLLPYPLSAPLALFSFFLAVAGEGTISKSADAGLMSGWGLALVAGPAPARLGGV